MTKKKKIIILMLVVLLGGGYVAKGKFFPPKVVKLKVNGVIYILPKQFMANLQGGRYATMTVALVLAAGQTDGTGAGGAAAATPPEGFGTLPEEALIRDIITNTITNQTSGSMISPIGRDKVKAEILAGIRSGTDVKVADILFTDVAVQ
jgi:hypothetical protein